ncbi:hypothetical protein MBAV_004770 [Candidatus Magnetobacterium bavaricum]|uniref:Uncharacterized protein n=1 Tax=Candidatus Magnetobacterium bavaricum TaxID=29290 RepID=A0A0F3GMB5_9BACT|nr:hypothetical protein MBAV_004770 [Candidatus Magnetobacterium bavaricum]
MTTFCLRLFWNSGSYSAIRVRIPSTMSGTIVLHAWRSSSVMSRFSGLPLTGTSMNTLSP